MKILIATDGSEFSQAAIDKCCEMFAKFEDIRIRIISIAEIAVPIPAEPLLMSAEYINSVNDAFQKQADAIVSRAAAQIRDCFRDSVVELTTKTEIGSSAQTIVSEAEEWKADLIVMGSHGRGFWERMILGSVSNAVAQHAPCSTLIVRKPKN